MSFGIYAFGHGGGVPGPYGNTNFAIVFPTGDSLEPNPTWEQCAQHPHWLVVPPHNPRCRGHGESRAVKAPAVYAEGCFLLGPLAPM